MRPPRISEPVDSCEQLVAAAATKEPDWAGQFVPRASPICALANLMDCNKISEKVGALSLALGK